MSIYNQLELADLKIAAFDLNSCYKDVSLNPTVAYALGVFSVFPCPETALNLIAVEPQFLRSMFSASDALFTIVPVESRSAMFTEFEKWREIWVRTDFMSRAIYRFVSRGSMEKTIRIEINSRNVNFLLQRLERVDLKKGMFSNAQNFLVEKLATDERAYRVLVDLVCIACSTTERPTCWDGLGSEVNPQQRLHAEVVIDVSPVVRSFEQELHIVTAMVAKEIQTG